MPWGPCGEYANHLLECPPYPSMPMCDGHWEEGQRLEAALATDPKLTKDFEKAVSKAELESRGHEFN